jgi:hypothetical protein
VVAILLATALAFVIGSITFDWYDDMMDNWYRKHFSK